MLRYIAAIFLLLCGVVAVPAPAAFVPFALKGGAVCTTAPVVVAGFNLVYTALQAATALDPSLTVTMGCSATLSSATVQITSGALTASDVLSFTNTGTISGTYNASFTSGSCGSFTVSTSGPLMCLTGSDTVANYQTALQNVKFNNTASDPTNGGANPSRTITWVVTE